MSYIGSTPTTAAFPFDQFTGNGTTTAFTLTYAPASATSIMVAISGVVQNPNLYSVIGTTLTFSPAPPSGTNNIAVLYLGLPVIGSGSPGNTAFLSSTDLTATAGQTVFASAGAYTPGFVQVYRNGARLGNADFTATNGTTITLASAAAAGDLVTIEYYTLTSLVNALPLTGGTVTGSTTFNTGVTVNGGLVSGFTGMKNRIINGNMVVDQRNAGAAVTTEGYLVDRWRVWRSQTYSIQQSTDAPAGFSNSIKVTKTNSTQSTYAYLQQYIEGFNFADMSFGTASAKTVVISFWVKSSVTGTFSAGLANSGNTRSYPATYTISLADTWTQASVTIPGDTSGTWVGSTNGTGAGVWFNFGANGTATANTWNASDASSGVTGNANLGTTNGATFYITGVQLERGTNATSFEFIDYGRQLAQCQRYYSRVDAVSGTCSSNFGAAVAYPVQMRASPSVSLSGIFKITDAVAADYSQSSAQVGIVIGTRVTNTGTQLSFGNFTGLTNYRPAFSIPNETSFILFSAEL